MQRNNVEILEKLDVGVYRRPSKVLDKKHLIWLRCVNNVGIAALVISQYSKPSWSQVSLIMWLSYVCQL